YSDELDEDIAKLRSIRDELAYLGDHCLGDNRPDGPIIERLGQGGRPGPIPRAGQVCYGKPPGAHGALPSLFPDIAVVITRDISSGYRPFSGRDIRQDQVAIPARQQ